MTLEMFPSTLRDAEMHGVKFRHQVGQETRILSSPPLNRAQVLKRSNSLIRAILEAPVSPHTWLIVNAGLAKYALQPGQSEVVITAKEIAQLPGYEDNWRIYDFMKIAAEKALDIRIKLESLNDAGHQKIRRGNVVTDTEYCEGSLMLVFNPRIFPMISGLTREYTPTKLAYLALLNDSSHAQRLYDYLRSFARLDGQDAQVELSVEAIREICALPDDVHPRTTDFKRYVIQHSTARINAHTDLEISHADLSKGRRILGYRWTVGFRNAGQMLNPVQRALVAQLGAAGIDPSMRFRLVAESSVDEVLDALAHYEDTVAAAKARKPGESGPIKLPEAGWLVKAIRERWAIKDPAVRLARRRTAMMSMAPALYEEIPAPDKPALRERFQAWLHEQGDRDTARLLQLAGRPDLASVATRFYPWLVADLAKAELPKVAGAPMAAPRRGRRPLPALAKA